MIKINLLPPAERQPKWPVNRLLLMAGFIFIFIIGSIYSYNVFKIWNIEQKLQYTHNQYQLLRPTQKIMNNANMKQQVLDKKNTILSNLTKENHSWYAIIQHLTATAPPQIWFTDMSKSEKGVMQIKGWASSYPLVAEFIQKMEQDYFFMEPALTNVEKDPVTKTTKFEIVVKPRGI